MHILAIVGGDTLSSYISSLVSISALIVSGISIWFSLKTSKEASSIQLVGQQFNAFDALGQFRVNNWDFNHIFELEESYYTIYSDIKSAVGKLNNAQRTKYLIKERALALRVFQTYEHTYYQYKNAKKTGVRDQIDFFSEVLSYFTGRLLRNPRLRYYWSSNGGNLSAYFEYKTISHYNLNVPKIDEQDINLFDITGPFGA